MSKIKAVHIDHSSNAKPRRLDSLAALVRSGALDSVFSGIELAPQPTLGFGTAGHDAELAAATLAELISLAKQTYEESE
jgi:hypothetical protein